MNRQDAASARKSTGFSLAFLASWWLALLLLAASFALLLRTVVPTIYTLDSAEFVIGAQTLGFVHAPGYPLYLTLLHLWLKLLPGDAGYAGNLFSALALAL
ncbi:MAG: DUF2723 domain-containing protein, partial [Anaerolineae bacterium]|nr:DUF2723 domain-containing protein [Anaerolineae bacterium]